MDDQDISQWISDLKRGDEQAVQLIWEEYFEKLVRMARRQLKGTQCRVVDEEDVALSAMNSFVQNAADGRFPKLDDRDDLWKLLVTITARKVFKQRRRQYAQKRGAGAVRGESVFAGGLADSGAMGIGQILGKEPTPELALMTAETCQKMLDELGDDTLKAIARLKLEGNSKVEIAEKLGCVTRTVDRKLDRIRKKWQLKNIS